MSKINKIANEIHILHGARGRDMTVTDIATILENHLFEPIPMASSQRLAEHAVEMIHHDVHVELNVPFKECWHGLCGKLRQLHTPSVQTMVTEVKETFGWGDKNSEEKLMAAMLYLTGGNPKTLAELLQLYKEAK